MIDDDDPQPHGGRVAADRAAELEADRSEAAPAARNNSNHARYHIVCRDCTAEWIVGCEYNAAEGIASRHARIHDHRVDHDRVDGGGAE